jgi:hypothetical protein
LNPIHKSVRKEILFLRRHYRREHKLTPYQVNNGSCDSFADDLLNSFGDGQAIWGEDFPSKFEPYMTLEDIERVGGHCFFFIEGLYFDAECVNGVDNPALLPFYQRVMSGKDNYERAKRERRNG